jgi:hypothetical protein
MATAVMQGAKVALLIADDDQRLLARREQEVLADLGGLAAVTGEQPEPTPGTVHVSVELLLAAVVRSRERPSRTNRR